MGNAPNSNLNNRIQIELDIGDLMMVADALMIGRNSAMMSSNNPAHRDRLGAIMQQICSFLPIPKHRLRDGGYVWFDAMKAVQECRFYDVFVATKSSYSGRNEFSLIIEADGKQYRVTDDRIDEKTACEAIAPLKEILDRQSPIDALGLETVSADVHVPSAKMSHNLSEERANLQTQLDKMGEVEGFYARVRTSKTNWQYGSSNRVYTVDVAAPAKDHDLIRETFARTIEELELGSTAPGPRM